MLLNVIVKGFKGSRGMEHGAGRIADSEKELNFEY
jgi:hypothetical protein